jgi:RNA polymerase-associated protein RTF1
LAKTLASKRGSTRNRDATGARAKKADALAALRQERKKVTRKDSSDSESSFGDDDDDSDDDYEDSGALKPWQKKAAESRKSRLDQVEESDEEMDQADDDNYKNTEDTQRVVQDAELEDYLKITVSRRKLGRWCNEPYFKKAVVGCFAKLFIGENEQGKRCYRLCRIVDVQPAPKGSYALPPVKKEMPVRCLPLPR